MAHNNDIIRKGQLGDRLKETVMSHLRNEDIEILGIEVTIKLREGYHDSAWWGWKNPNLVATVPNQENQADGRAES